MAGSRCDHVASLEVLKDAHHPSRRHVGGPADRARAAHRQRWKEHRVAARKDAKPLKVAGGDADTFEVLEIPARILDAGNGSLARQRCDARRLGDHLRELRNVVQPDRNGAVRGEGAVEREQGRLVHRIVERWGDQRSRRTQAGGGVDLDARRGEMTLRHPADHGHAARRRRDDAGEHRATRGFIERRRLACRPKRQQSVHPAGDGMLDQPYNRGFVHVAVLAQRRDQSRHHTDQLSDLDHRVKATACGQRLRRCSRQGRAVPL